ncbi:MAG: DUF2764 family protein [Kiritimatiellia bacterium]
MPKKYYYFCASLPTLQLGEKPPWTMEQFLGECSRLLAADDVQQVHAALHDDYSVPAPAESSRFVQEWRAWEIQLRNATARWRAARAGADMAGKLRDHPGFDCALEKGVNDACARENPLERELELDRLRWRWAEQAALVDPFGMAAILGFALRLRLALRWAALREDSGRAAAAAFIEQAAVF